jgi:hypothetical protein
MAWTAPRTWTSGELVSAAQMNEQVRDNLTVLKIAVDNNGKIPALSATYVADLSGANLTGVAKLAAANSFTAGKQDFSAGASTRVVLPVGADRWAT